METRPFRECRWSRSRERGMTNGYGRCLPSHASLRKAHQRLCKVLISIGSWGRSEGSLARPTYCPMTGVAHAVAYRRAACTGHPSEHSSSMQALMMGRWVPRWACSLEACEGSAAVHDPAAVAYGCPRALPANRPGWSHRHRCRYPDWARARLGMPVPIHISIASL